MRDDVHRILYALDELDERARDRVMFNVATHTGWQLSELESLDIDRLLNFADMLPKKKRGKG